MSATVLRADALACHTAAVAAVAPGGLVATRLGRAAGALVLVGADGAPIARHAGPVVVVGAGKAARAMGAAAAAAADAQCTDGLVIVPHDGRVGEGRVAVACGAHPVPDADGAAASERLLAMVSRASSRTLVLGVLSGGASALLVAPARGLSLADKQAVTAGLLAAGADIVTLNTVRKHCSRVKGGGLARAAGGAAGLWVLVLSDVVGDDLATIASGPTVADPTTFVDARAALARHLPPAAIPAAVGAHLARGAAGEIPETVKAGDPVLARTHTLVVGGNGHAVAAAAAAARERGYATEVLAEPVVGDAAAAGRALAARLAALPRDRPVALVAGGETTVRVVAGGRGGRCLHLALAAAEAIAGEPAVLLAAGTDGIDGPTEAAGGCVDGGTMARAAAAGLDVTRALARTDSHAVLRATADLVVTGPTGTNVADVVVALRAAC